MCHLLSTCIPKTVALVGATAEDFPEVLLFLSALREEELWFCVLAPKYFSQHELNGITYGQGTGPLVWLVQ